MTTNRVPSGVPTGGQFAASARAEASVSLNDLGYPEPNQGTNCFHSCPARDGGTCDDHGTKTWSTHPGDLEVRACVETTDGDIISTVSDAEAQFFTLYSADSDGLWSALEDYDSRDEAESALRNAAFTSPADIYAVRAAVDIVDPHNHAELEALALAALEHLPGERHATLERSVRPGGEPIRWNGSAHDHLRRTLHAVLVDTTQDVPTQKTLSQARADLSIAQSAVTDAIVSRDIGTGSDADIADARLTAEHFEGRVERADALRERASLRRIAAGRPTVFDVREIEERHANARDEARRATNAADSVRDAAISSGRNLADDPEVVAAANVAEIAALEEFARQKEFLAAANEAWQAYSDAGHSLTPPRTFEA